MFRGVKYSCTTMSFGICSAPRTFTKLMKPIMKVIRQIGARPYVYLDDSIAFFNSNEEEESGGKQIFDLFMSLELTINCANFIDRATSSNTFRESLCFDYYASYDSNQGCLQDFKETVTITIEGSHSVFSAIILRNSVSTQLRGVQLQPMELSQNKKEFKAVLESLKCSFKKNTIFNKEIIMVRMDNQAVMIIINQQTTSESLIQIQVELLNLMEIHQFRIKAAYIPD
ncbi:MAG: hypothetical protein EZS28_034129 [Streblomastix strix]|uniref:Reverse transcriptase domain-containing protein n=1 Tax=Streblomastix strix TaxID=222440 RepID=A0A5J4UJF5_9EUKA|nr:MAG: hypothetical protein EZS28_034129 [Streblomastix strix]